MTLVCIKGSINDIKNIPYMVQNRAWNKIGFHILKLNSSNQG